MLKSNKSILFPGVIHQAKLFCSFITINDVKHSYVPAHTINTTYEFLVKKISSQRLLEYLHDDNQVAISGVAAQSFKKTAVDILKGCAGTCPTQERGNDMK